MPYKLSTPENTAGVAIVENTGSGPLIASPQDALDLIATARYECHADKLVLYKQDVDERFFDLSTRLAGEVLQKFVNYSMRLALVGDYSGYTSKSLRDFIYESNKGTAVFFAADLAEALARLG